MFLFLTKCSFKCFPILPFLGCSKTLGGQRSISHPSSGKSVDFQEEQLHPDWLVEWPKASASPIRRRPASVAMMCHLLDLLPMTGLFPGKAVRFPQSLLVWVCGQNGTGDEGRAWAECQSRETLWALSFIWCPSPPLLRSAPAFPFLTGTGFSNAAHRQYSTAHFHCSFKLAYSCGIWHGRDVDWTPHN